jgi:hypothetical protein
MNTLNGNFIEKSIPDTKNATIAINIAGEDATMTVDKFAATLPVLPYKVYTALLTQEGTNVPIPTILYNNTNLEISWLYSAVGNYSFYITNIESSQKIIVDVSNKVGIYSNTITYGYSTNLNSASGFINVAASGPGADGAMQNHPFEIRVYN